MTTKDLRLSVLGKLIDLINTEVIIILVIYMKGELRREVKTIGILKNMKRTRVYPPEYKADLHLNKIGIEINYIEFNEDEAKNLGFFRISNRCDRCGEPNPREFQKCPKCETELLIYENAVGVDVKVDLVVRDISKK